MARILNTMALLLAAFALLVPDALAERPDDRGGMLGIGAASATSSATRPDDRGEARGPGGFTPELSVRPDDRADLRGPGAVPFDIVTQSTPDGFDWIDASVGAVGAFGLALILGAIVVATHTRRSRAAF